MAELNEEERERKRQEKLQKEEEKKKRMQMTAEEVYQENNAPTTRLLFSRLKKLGSLGLLAVELLRAQKNSDRGKLQGYKKSKVFNYSGVSYGRKAKALSNIARILLENNLGIKWGWGEDPAEFKIPWVLYLELPTGQVSFHNRKRYEGPDYEGQWDKKNASCERILEFCDRLLEAEERH